MPRLFILAPIYPNQDLRRDPVLVCLAVESIVALSPADAWDGDHTVIDFVHGQELWSPCPVRAFSLCLAEQAAAAAACRLDLEPYSVTDYLPSVPGSRADAQEGNDA